jgi:peptide/nickel transport system permease protein
LGVVVITFLLSHAISINPITAWLGKSAALDPSLVAIYTKTYHLDDPLYVQFFYYIVGLVHLQLGYSPARHEPVSVVIAQTFPYTLQLIFLAMIMAIALGIVGGVLSAKFSDGPLEKVIKVTYISSYATPTFMVALVLLLVFSSMFKLLPTSGLIAPFVALPHHITGIPMLDALLEGRWSAFLSLFEHALLPSFALALTLYGFVTRLLGSSISDVMGSVFVKAARARGISESSLLIGYGLKNSSLQLITLIALLLTFSLTGDVFVETIFSYPGLGQYAVQAIQAFDYPGILATTLVYTTIIVIVNLSADLLYFVADPRVQRS